MDALLRPLDVARVHAIRTLGPVGRVFVASREKRVAAGAAFAIVTALALAGLAPMWTLAISPIVLGVPHVVADLRYLVVRAGLHRDRALVVLVGAPLLAAALGGGLRAGTIAAATALVLGLVRGARTRGSLVRALLGLVALAPVAFLAWTSPARADATFAHVHNVLAVVLWWGFRPRGERAGLRTWALVGIVIAAIAILAGVLDPLLSLGLGFRSHPRGFGVGALVTALAPGVSTSWALRLLVLYAFGQSIHYAIWLRAVPDEDRKQPTPRPFAASWRALLADLGPWLVGGALVSAALFAAWSLFDVAAARSTYLRGAAFHGHLELAVLAFALGRGKLRS